MILVERVIPVKLVILLKLEILVIVVIMANLVKISVVVIFWVKRVGTGTPPSPLIWILSQVYPKFDRLFLAHFLGGPINY